MFLWGAGWPALKILTPELSLEVVSFWRFFIMTLAFISVLIYIKKPITLPLRALPFIISSAILNTLFMIFAFLGVKYGSAGSGGVIITTISPIITFFIIALITKTIMPTRQFIGLFLGLIGGAIMFQVSHITLEGFFSGAEFYFLLCALVWSGVTILAQKSQVHIHPIHYSFFIAIIATLILFMLALPYDILAVSSQGVTFWSALLYLGIFGQTVATTIYFIASGKMGSSHTSIYMFLVPIFALIMSYILLNESIEWHVVGGGAISLLALYIIQKKPNKSL
ncbi:MAG TPA: DMT family transporter [Helicobacteraceae bacterium]|nr:DMT family transporter [Helicobacteraceae bacterium]